MAIDTLAHLPNTGSVRFRDSYGVIHETSWSRLESTHVIYQITTTVKDPRRPGLPKSGRISDFIAYDDGYCSIEQVVIRINDDGYSILDSESSVDACEVQRNYICQPPFDTFQWYLDNIQIDGCEHYVTGPGFQSPGGSDQIVFAPLDTGGEPEVGNEYLSFINVWN